MTNNVNDEFLRAKIEKYVEDNGWHGFFGLLATISPDKVDKKDLEEYKTELPGYNNTSPSQVMHFENTTPNISVKAASIYAEEHIPAVQDDLREKDIVGPIEVAEVKTKVLEPQRSSSPNPWGESKVVLPGELDL